MHTGATHIWDVWGSGLTGRNDYIGDAEPCTRVTVEPDWWLTAESKKVGMWDRKKTPIRWFQDEDNDQVEVEVPQVNLKTVEIDQNLTQDAATITITLINSGNFNQKGFLFFGHGYSQEARNLWDQTPNEWSGVLAPGSLLRVYTGYGGKNKTIKQAVADGNLVQYGTYIVDDVSGRSTLTLKGRDTSALLIDQQLYPPLVPENKYPLEYHRWVYTTRDVAQTTVRPENVDVPFHYLTSGSDMWDAAYGGSGHNAPVHGHKPSWAVDGSTDSFALSVGNSYAAAPWARDWWEFKPTGPINAIRILPWKGPYQVWVSIMENGVWQGTSKIPYDPSTIIATQSPGISTFAGIPYVATQSVGGKPQLALRYDQITLPRSYRPQKVRITFASTQYTDWGPWHYRSGIRDVRGVQHNMRPVPAWSHAVAFPSDFGYWVLSDDGRVEPFGDARALGSVSVDWPNDMAMALTPNEDGTGYVILLRSGKTQTFGAGFDVPARFSVDAGACDLILKPGSTDSGWMVELDGTIHSFGSAASYWSVSLRENETIVAAAPHPTDGMWLLTSLGVIYTFGSAVNYGNPTADANFKRTLAKGYVATDLQQTESGNGYLILDQLGNVYAYGDAVNKGAAGARLPERGTVNPGVRPFVQSLVMQPADGSGYAMMTNEGKMIGFGDYGGVGGLIGDPASGKATMRSDGNYCVDEATEIFTDRGWLRWDEVTGGDSTLAINPETGLPESVEVNHVYRSDPKRHEMIRFEGEIDALTTPDHRWLVKEGIGYTWVTSEATDGHQAPIADPDGTVRGHVALAGTRASYEGVVWCPSVKHHNWLARRNGTVYYTGNTDYVDIVKDLLLWSGFWLHEDPMVGEPDVFGNIESTGSYASSNLTEDFFDKKPPIDIIKQLRDIVGGVSYSGRQGEFHWHCVDEATEILTKRGWLFHNELRSDDLVLSYNRDTNMSEWTTIESVYRDAVEDADLISMESSVHSSLTTPNHRWWTLPRHKNRECAQWRTTETLNWESSLPIAAPCADVPTEPTLTDELVELVAWWYTEGTPQFSGGCIYQSHKANPEKVQSIHRCFEAEFGTPGPLGRGGRKANEDYRLLTEKLAVGGTYAEVARITGRDRHTLAAWHKQGRRRSHAWRSESGYREGMTHFFFGPEVRQVLEEHAPDRRPTMEFLLQLTQEQLDLFIETSIRADGNADSVGGYGPYWRFTQKDLGRVSAFEYACILSGVAPRTHLRFRAGTLPHGKPYEGLIHTTQVLKTKNTSPQSTRRTQTYTGTVWCPQLSRNHVWLARRDGTVYYTGNSPNWWQSGNFLDDGTHTNSIPDLPGDAVILDWSPTYTKKYDRSEIIGTSDEPYLHLDGTVTSSVVPPQGWLRGMVVPAMFHTPLQVKKEEQQIMTELTALQLWFRRHTGTVKFVANPCIGVDDQIRILEKATSETYNHYVLGMSFSHDFKSGSYTMTATTYWLGDTDSWAVTKDNVGEFPNEFKVSNGLREFLLNSSHRETFSDDPDAPLVVYPESEEPGQARS